VRIQEYGLHMEKPFLDFSYLISREHQMEKKEARHHKF